MGRKAHLQASLRACIFISEIAKKRPATAKKMMQLYQSKASDAERFVVEKQVRKSRQNGVAGFIVKWKGYPWSPHLRTHGSL